MPYQRISQAPAALVDPGAILNAGSSSFSTSTSTLNLTFAAGPGAITDGLREGLARYRWPLLDLLPTFNRTQHHIEILLQSPAFTHVATLAAGVYAAIVDSTTVDASLQGLGVSWSTNSAVVDILGPMDEDNRPTTKNLAADAVACRYAFGFDGTDYQVQGVVQAQAEGTTRWEAVGVSQPTTGLLRGANTWYLELGAFRGATGSAVGHAMAIDVGLRLL